MKKQIILLIAVLISCLLISCDFSSIRQLKPDSYYFTKTEPFEWDKDYVLAATNFPPQIQIWAPQTNKMVHKFSLCENEEKWGKGSKRSLIMYDLFAHDGIIWFVGVGISDSLVRLECKTGEFKFIPLDISPYEVSLMPKYDNGKDAVFVASASYPQKGISIRILDMQGNVIQKNDISYADEYLDLRTTLSKYYDNENYYTIVSKEEDLNKNSTDIFKVLQLTNTENTTVFNIPKEKIIQEDIINNAFGKKLQRFSYSPMLLLYNNASKNRFMELSVQDLDYRENEKDYIRFLYKVNSLLDFDFEYTGIYYDEADAKSFWSVEEYGDNIYITGKQLCLIPEKEHIDGLEVAMYSKNGGKPIKTAPLLYANRVYCEMKDDCAWFSKDVYSQDINTFEWDYSDKTGIYKLDYKNQKVYEYSPDGTCLEIEWKDCN